MRGFLRVYFSVGSIALAGLFAIMPFVAVVYGVAWAVVGVVLYLFQRMSNAVATSRERSSRGALTLMPILVAIALFSGGCATADCPDTAKQWLVERGEFIVWCQR